MRKLVLIVAGLISGAAALSATPAVALPSAQRCSVADCVAGPSAVQEIRYRRRYARRAYRTRRYYGGGGGYYGGGYSAPGYQRPIGLQPSYVPCIGGSTDANGMQVCY